MAKNDNVIGLAIGLDTSSLKAGLLDAGRRLKEVSAEFKASTAGMDNWASTADGLSAKLKQLNSNLDIQKQVLALMEKEYKELYEGQDENSAAAVKLRTDILNQKAAIAQTEKSIRKYGDSLDELARAGVNTTDELEALKRAEVEAEKAAVEAAKAHEKELAESLKKAEKEAQELARAQEKELAEAAKRAAQEEAELNQKLEEQKEASKKASEGFTVLKGTMANLLAQGITALISGFKDLATAAINSAESTREYREDLGRLEASFKQANQTTDTARATYEKLYAAIGETDTAVEAAQQIALLADSAEQAAKWSSLATGIVGTFGDALKPETFYEAANETIKLNEATGAFTQMLEGTGVSVEDFNTKLQSLNTEEEKQAYMLEVSQEALGKAGEEYEKVNEDIIKAREETSKLADKQAELGEKMEPVSSAITTFKTELLDAVLANVDFEKVAEEVTNILTTFKDDVIPKVIEGFTWLKDNLPTITGYAVALVAAYTGMKIASVITGVVKAVKAWKVATEGMTIAQKLLNLAQAANPVGLIIALVTSLIAYIIYLWNTNDEFREAVIKIWDKIKQAFVDSWKAIKEAWGKAGEFFSNLWTTIKEKFANVKSYFKEKFKEAWDGVKSVFSKVGDFFGGIWTTIKEKFADIGQKVGDTVSSTFKAAVNGLLATAEKILNTPINGINKAIDVLNEVPGVNLGKLDTFELPRMAKGGIVDRATAALIGEDGKEAIIPLERNLGWIKKLSASIVKELPLNNLVGANGNLTNNTTNFTQIINAPSQPPLDDLYRRTNNLLNLKAVN